MRIVLTAALLALPQETPANVEAMMARYRTMTSTSDAARKCDGSTDGDVLVCGQTESKQRLPLPDERGPPDGPRRPTGDARASLDHGGRPCPPTGCTGVNLLKAPVVLFKIAKALLGSDD